MKLQLKYWDCIDHKWKWFFLPIKQPYHNTWFCNKKFKTDKEKCLKWGEVWLIWLGFPIKRINK